MNLTKKEISEFLAERRRLGQYYREPLRDVVGDLRDYMDAKQKVLSRGAELSEDTGISRRRKDLMKKLGEIEIHQEEILRFSDKFTSAARRIKRLQDEQARIEKRLRVNNLRELRGLGRGLAIASDRRKIEDELGLTADQIKEKIRQVQLAEKKLKSLEI